MTGMKFVNRTPYRKPYPLSVQGPHESNPLFFA